MTASVQRSFDAIVVGAGHNGLVCATYLAKAGLRTLVLERRTDAGGALADSEIVPGAHVPALAHTVGRLRASVVRELGLHRHGLRLVQPQVRAVSVQPDGAPITLWGDPARTASEIATFSGRDAAAWMALDAQVRAHAGVIDRLANMTPPDPKSPDPGTLLGTLAVGLGYRGLSADDRREFLRVLPMAVDDFLGDFLETDSVRAAVAIRGMRFSSLGPRSAGSVQQLLADSAGNSGGLAGETVYARGGSVAVADAIAGSFLEAGGAVRTGEEVALVRDRDGEVAGVTLATGEEIHAPIVVSGVDPRRLLGDLIDPETLGPHLGWQVGNLRIRGVTAKVNFALTGLPHFIGIDPEHDAVRLRGRILVAPSMRYLDDAADAAKYGRFPTSPWLEATIPSLVDPLLVDGAREAGVRHVMSVIVQSATYELRDGGPAAWDARREELGDLCVRVIEGVAPGFGALVVGRQVLTPLDLERDFGLTEGHPLHGEPALDQWFAWRPLLGLASYRMPVRGLYLAGSGAHPGGGVTGLPGRNAAREILRDRGGRRRPRP